MKKILILSDINSAHTEKWVKSLIEYGFEIHLYSLRNSNTSWHKNLDNFCFSSQPASRNRTLFSKLIYLKALPQIKGIIREFDPDFVHAHYASSYGLLGALVYFPNYYVSVWGSDVYQFPKKSLITKWVLKFVLKKASKIFSTGNVMAKEIEKYTDKKIEVVSFGIDVEKFHPIDRKGNKEVVKIGVIKSLEYTYGIDILIKALDKVIQSHKNIELRIVGGGSLKKDYQKMVVNLNLQDYVVFVGKIPYDKVVEEYHRLDVFVNPSRFESFGVSILEASACGLPVVATKAGGQVELVNDNETGILVEPENVSQLADAISTLVENGVLRLEMGRKGKTLVENNYTLSDSVKKMISYYI